MTRLRNLLKRLIGRIFMNLKNGYIWNKVVIKVFHENGIKNEWMPFYWTDEIILCIATTFPLKKGFNVIPKAEMPLKWTYKWELQNLNKKVINHDSGELDFSTVSNKNLSIYKRNAIVIKDLDIGRYKLLISFEDSEGQTTGKLPYPITVRNEVDYRGTVLMPIIVSVFALIVSIISLIISFKK